MTIHSNSGSVSPSDHSLSFKSTTKQEKLHFRNALLLSIAFGVNFFGISLLHLLQIGTNTFMNFAVPILGMCSCTTYYV